MGSCRCDWGTLMCPCAVWMCQNQVHGHQLDCVFACVMATQAQLSYLYQNMYTAVMRRQGH